MTSSTPCHPAWADDARGGQRPHFLNAFTLQDAGARLQRCARRAHIVDEHDDGAARVAQGGSRREGIANVAMTLRRGQPCLGRGCAHSPKPGHDGKSQVPGEIGRLVEAAFAPLRIVERNGNRARGPIENVGAVPSHQCAERPRQRSAPLVLQRMDDRSESAVVGANRSCAVHQSRRPPTPGTLAERHADRSPRWQRIATGLAERRREGQNRSPARLADRAARRTIQRLVAGGTGRRQHDRQHRVQRIHSRPNRFRFSISAVRCRFPRRGGHCRRRARSGGPDRKARLCAMKRSAGMAMGSRAPRSARRSPRGARARRTAACRG